MTLAWKPTEEDRKKVINIVAQGSSVEMAAISVGVDPKTLRKHCMAEIEEGRTYDKQHCLNAIREIGTQKSHPTAALRANIWRMGALHGIIEPSMPSADHNSEDAQAENRAAELEQLDVKLAPYLAHEKRHPGGDPAITTVMASVAYSEDPDVVIFGAEPNVNTSEQEARVDLEPEADWAPEIAPAPGPTAAPPETKPSLSELMVRARAALED